MKAYEITRFGVENLTLTEREIPVAKADEVLVRFRAASLNYRDLLMVTGRYNPNLKMPIVPCSDGAGEVVEVGAEVTRWKVGDRVMPIFMQGWLDGEVEFRKARTALGGDLDGTLREFGAFNEQGLVRIPEGLTYEEASTLPCAAVTAYNALFESGAAKGGDSVLIQGTGGVSIFALQFAHALGCRTIVTSSSDDKLLRAEELGADETVNYVKPEDWEKAVLELTEKQGVDHVVEVGGAGTMAKSAVAAKMGGHIAVIGVLSGKGGFDPTMILMKALKMHGIFVGSRAMFEKMNEFISAHGIRPVVDKVFLFAQAQEALRTMESQTHFGKIVIKFD